MNRVFDTRQPTFRDLISSFEGLMRLIHAKRHNRTFDDETFRLEMAATEGYGGLARG